MLAKLYDDVEVCCRLIDATGRIDYVDDALVRHERASNEIRDGRQMVRDPYSIVHARAVFARFSARRLPTPKPKSST